MNLERNTKENPFKILASILVLSGVLLLFYYLKGEPNRPQTYNHLANLKSLTEDKQLFSASDPVPTLILFFWKKISGTNYVPAFRTVSVFLFALFLHLSMRLFVRNEWKINHYGLIYLIAFLPYLNSVPEENYSELVTAIFILLIFLSFRLESILDVLLFAILTIFAFFSNFMTFLWGFSAFVIKAGTLGAQRTKTTVFYKRKNIPKLILLVYLAVFFLAILILGLFGFFGDSSFRFIFQSLLNHFLGFGVIIGFIFIGQYLLKSEKELNSPVSTGILIVLIVISGIYVFRKDTAVSLNELVSQKNEIHAMRMKGLISKADRIFADKSLADFSYFHSKEKLSYLNFEEMGANDLLVVNGIWVADRNQIDKLFRSRKPLYYPLNSTSVLMRKELVEKILPLQSKDDLQFRGKLLKYLSESKKRTRFDGFRKFLGSLFDLKLP